MKNMRATNEAFEAEAMRRSEVFRKKQRTRIKQATAGLLTVCLCFGAFGLWKNLQPSKNAHYSGETANKSNSHSVDGYSDNAPAYEAVLNGDQQDNPAKEDNRGGDGNAVSSGKSAESAEPEMQPLELNPEQDVYAPDTTEIVLKIYNPNEQAVTLDALSFVLSFEDAEGYGMAYVPVPNDEESSAADTVLAIGAGDSVLYTLDLFRYGMFAPLSAGVYKISCIDPKCTEAVFSVKGGN